jgi:hypothetical protein
MRSLGASGPPSLGAGRRRRDRVVWVALSLVVATALSVVARSVGPPRPVTAAHHPQHAAQAVPTSRPAGTTKTGRANRRRHDDPKPSPTTTSSLPANTTTATTPTTTTAVPATTATTTAEVRPATAPSRTRDTKRRDRRSATTPALAGMLRYPDDIETSIPFTSASGLAAVRASWRGGEALKITLGCGSVVTSGSGTHGLSLVVAGKPGVCTVSISLGPGQRGTVAYTLRVRVPPTAPAASGAG